MTHDVWNDAALGGVTWLGIPMLACSGAGRRGDPWRVDRLTGRPPRQGGRS